MVRACCVLGCPSGANMPSHQFPKNPDQFKIWKRTVWSPKISDLSDSTLHKCAVCYRHFKDSDYILGHRLRKLKEDVVPSLNLPAVHTFNEEADKENVMSVNSSDHIEADCNVQENVMSVNSFDHSETDCTTQTSVNESNANEELVKPTSPKRQKLELLEKNCKKADPTPKASRLYSTAKSLRRRQISTMSKMKSFKRRLQEVQKYSKSKTIQTLMSSISPSQRRFIHMKMRAAKYAPRVCKKLYYMVAKEKALAQ